MEQSKVLALMWLKLIQSNPLKVGEFANDGDSIDAVNQEMGPFLLAANQLDERLRSELSATEINDAERMADRWVTPEFARLNTSADTGDRQAQFDFAMLHFAYDSNLKYDDGIPYLELAAKQGHPKAAYRMGERFSDRRLPIHDIEKALEWYQEAADAGHYLGRNSVLLAHCEGKGVERDLEQCYKWLAIHHSKRTNFPENLEPYWQQYVLEGLTEEQKRNAEEAARQWVDAHPDADYGT